MMTPAILTDAYKISHKGFMIDDTTMIYSNWTARSDKHFPVKGDLWDKKHVVMGIQEFCQEFMVEFWNDGFFSKKKKKACKKIAKFFTKFFNQPFDAKQFEELHDLGYLPITIKGLPDGTLCPIGVPCVFIFNNHKAFAWLTNYLETLFSCEMWKIMTVSTIAKEFRKLCDHWAALTCDNNLHVDYQCHDFSLRGAHGIYDGAKYGVGHLLFFKGTDTLSAVERGQMLYGKGCVGTSIPASEHSVACLGYAKDGELESYRKWITKDYPSGLVSLVSDTTDYWKVLSDYLPVLRDDIMSRNGKVVIRPDSGDPADIICGYNYYSFYEEDMSKIQEHADIAYYANYEYLINLFDDKAYKVSFIDGDHRLSITNVDTRVVKGSVELLWENFGGMVNSKGFRELDSHIGLIYGDSITYEVAKNVFERLLAKGFASNCVVFGIGSFTYNYMTRDTLGFAVKATAAYVGTDVVELQKNPVTDDGTKKSAKGFLSVVTDRQVGFKLVQGMHSPFVDDATVFYYQDGKILFRQVFEEIQERCRFI